MARLRRRLGGAGATLGGRPVISVSESVSSVLAASPEAAATAPDGAPTLTLALGIFGGAAALIAIAIAIAALLWYAAVCAPFVHTQTHTHTHTPAIARRWRGPTLAASGGLVAQAPLAIALTEPQGTGLAAAG